jgi:hypothetical protein
MGWTGGDGGVRFFDDTVRNTWCIAVLRVRWQIGFLLQYQEDSTEKEM